MPNETENPALDETQAANTDETSHLQHERGPKLEAELRNLVAAAAKAKSPKEFNLVMKDIVFVSQLRPKTINDIIAEKTGLQMPGHNPPVGWINAQNPKARMALPESSLPEYREQLRDLAKRHFESGPTTPADVNDWLRLFPAIQFTNPELIPHYAPLMPRMILRGYEAIDPHGQSPGPEAQLELFDRRARFLSKAIPCCFGESAKLCQDLQNQLYGEFTAFAKDKKGTDIVKRYVDKWIDTGENVVKEDNQNTLISPKNAATADIINSLHIKPTKTPIDDVLFPFLQQLTIPKVLRDNIEQVAAPGSPFGKYYRYRHWDGGRPLNFRFESYAQNDVALVSEDDPLMNIPMTNQELKTAMTTDVTKPGGMNEWVAKAKADRRQGLEGEEKMRKYNLRLETLKPGENIAYVPIMSNHGDPVGASNMHGAMLMAAALARHPVYGGRMISLNPVFMSNPQQQLPGLIDALKEKYKCKHIIFDFLVHGSSNGMEFDRPFTPSAFASVLTDPEFDDLSFTANMISCSAGGNMPRQFEAFLATPKGKKLADRFAIFAQSKENVPNFTAWRSDPMKAGLKPLDGQAPNKEYMNGSSLQQLGLIQGLFNGKTFGESIFESKQRISRNTYIRGDSVIGGR